MKRSWIFPILIVLALLTMGCTQQQQSAQPAGRMHKGPSGRPTMPAVVSPNVSLTSVEKSDLINMAQEEKLARDVYLTLYNKWKLVIFKNIAQSEMRHMDAVLKLIEKYGLKNPITNDSVGVFKDPKFKKLYEELVAKGNKSEVDALKVGAMIEELDIADLQKCINRTDKQDIKNVYENLMRGSRNHLRAFVSALNSLGATYTPKYISEKEFQTIISSSMEKGGNMR